MFFFIALIGFKSVGIIVLNSDNLVSFGHFTNPHITLTLVGMVITAIMMARGVKDSIVTGIVLTKIIGIPLGVTNLIGIYVISNNYCICF